MLGFLDGLAWLHAGLPRRFLALAGLDRRLIAGLLGWFAGLASGWAS